MFKLSHAECNEKVHKMRKLGTLLPVAYSNRGHSAIPLVMSVILEIQINQYRYINLIRNRYQNSIAEVLYKSAQNGFLCFLATLGYFDNGEAGGSINELHGSQT